MRDPKRIDIILETIKTIWEASPDLRLAQIIMNAIGHPGDPYYYEDDDLLEKLLIERKRSTMVMAKLHLICGNCGCNDDWEWEYVAGKSCDGEVTGENVWLKCGNCTTIHAINDSAVNSKE